MHENKKIFIINSFIIGCFFLFDGVVFNKPFLTFTASPVLVVFLSFFISKSKKTALLFLMVAIIAGSIIYANKEYQLRNAKEKADLIIVLVEKYYKDTGEYPDSLADLNENILPVYYRGIFYKKMSYGYSKKDLFIAIDSGFFDIHFYSFNKKQWSKTW